MPLPQSPVSPIASTVQCQSTFATIPLPSQQQHPQNNPEDSQTTPQGAQRAAWQPFTLRWYYLVMPILASFGIGTALITLVLYSEAHNGLGTDDGSSGILFGWRFTPTLIAVLYTQMTVILFQDMKRTEPFARLSKAPPDGLSAFGTVLQSPKAWWTIFADVIFRRKRTGKTSSSLICAALINTIALLVISPLSSALLTSEETAITRSVDFTRLLLKKDVTIPAIATRETYYRTISALTRNVSTSAWVTDESLTLPYWPISETAQLGPRLISSYAAWKAESTTIRSQYQCQEMALESAEMSNKHYSQVYDVQERGPFNGTQPMVTFVLKSDDGCRYELSLHPTVDLAYAGGVTWSEASKFLPVGGILPLGGRPIKANVTSTHVYARLNTTDACKGRDILIMNTPWTAPLPEPEGHLPMRPINQTYVPSSDFRMRGLLCGSQYSFATHSSPVTMSSASQLYVDMKQDVRDSYHTIPDNLVDIPGFQNLSMRDDWSTYFDQTSTGINTQRAAGIDIKPADAGLHPSYSGMAPVLATLFGYNITNMLLDRNISHTAARIKGRFFMELLRDAINSPKLVHAESIAGEVTRIEERVIVQRSTGFALAALSFTSSILLIIVYFRSQLSRRPLNLTSDPASLVGLSLLLQPESARSSTFRSIHNLSRSDVYATLRRETYLTSEGYLIKGSTEFALVSPHTKTKTDWRPRVVQIRMLAALCTFLIAVMVAILVLNAFSAQSRLFQTAFVYEADLSKFGASFSNFAPISIAPTIISVSIGLWWDQLDSVFRTLQPYISMANGPTPVYAGAGLTYRSKSWIGAALKAARYKHWILFMVTLGSVLSQVLTVSMSALIERETSSVAQNITLQPDLEIRQFPLTSEVQVEEYERPTEAPIAILNELYLDTSKNWLYGAGIQDSFNGSKLPWTSGGWSFLPLDLSNISSLVRPSLSGTTPSKDSTQSSSNISITLPAIRARLDCKSIPELANITSWMKPVVNISTIDMLPERAEYFNRTKNLKKYKIPSRLFQGTDAQTSVLSEDEVFSCCANGSIHDLQPAITGYWSPVIPRKWQRKGGAEGSAFPHQDMTWPLAITPKWIVGTSIPGEYGEDILFEKEPEIQAAQCQVIIESTEAAILMDTQSKNVYSHKINGPIMSVDAAWRDAFKGRERVGDGYAGPLNLTTSFGVLFLDSLLGAGGRAKSVSLNGLDKAFVLQDQVHGTNMDLMTNSMYTAVNKDPRALLNYTTLVDQANRTMQAFFQHFVNSGLSLKSGGYVYQPITTGGSLATRGTLQSNSPSLASQNQGTTATITHRIRVLRMNIIATSLSAAILAWLIGTSCIVICIQRRYISPIIRDVHLIADMLLLVAGSDKFLEMVHQEGASMKKFRDVSTMLGWFKDEDGTVRWGVEVVGGMNAVEWVDAPKDGWHVQEKKPFSKRLPLWNKP